jgi:hypothetical protein
MQFAALVICWLLYNICCSAPTNIAGTITTADAAAPGLGPGLPVATAVAAAAVPMAAAMERCRFEAQPARHCAEVNLAYAAAGAA